MDVCCEGFGDFCNLSFERFFVNAIKSFFNSVFVFLIFDVDSISFDWGNICIVNMTGRPITEQGLFSGAFSRLPNRRIITLDFNENK